MPSSLKDRIQQQKFASVYQEATLNLLVCADHMQRTIEVVCERYGITSAQYNVLRILRGVHPEGHPRCEIIRRMIQVAPDVTRLIDRLEKAGYAKRARSTEDRRLSLTLITTAGLKLLEKMQPEIDHMDTAVRERLTEAEARTLSNLCEKIYTD